MHVCEHFGSETGLRRLALAGGVALNCTANGKLVRSGLFDEVYIQPAAGDDGAALGAALYQHLRWPANPRIAAPCSVLWARAFAASSGDSRWRTFAGKHPGGSRFTRWKRRAGGGAADRGWTGDWPGTAAAWSSVRAHWAIAAFWPTRAARDARPDQRHGQEARGLSALCAGVSRWRKCIGGLMWLRGRELPYMITIVDVRRSIALSLPAITHVERSARVQTVSAGDNPDFTVLRAVGEHGKRNGAEHQLQREGPTDREYTRGGIGHSWAPASNSCFWRCVDLASLKGSDVIRSHALASRAEHGGQGE